MKKLVLLLAVTMTCTLGVSYAKEKTVADQVEQVASHATTAVGNVIDSTKVAVKEGTHLIDTSSNFKAVYNDVKSGVLGLASALKVGAEHVYTVIVREQIVKAISSLLLIIIMGILCYILYKLSRKTYASHLEICGYKPDGSGQSSYNIDLDDSAKGVASAIIMGGSCLALIVGVIILCSTYNDIIGGIVNPEYGAMHDIMEFVSTNVKH